MTLLLSLSGGEVTKPRFAQFFHGSLASLTIRPGKMESQKVISCLQACKEGLDINSLESLGQGIKVRNEPASPPIRNRQRRPMAHVLGKWSPPPPARLSCLEVVWQQRCWRSGETCDCNFPGGLALCPEIPRWSPCISSDLYPRAGMCSLATRRERFCFSGSWVGGLLCLFAK